MSKNNSICCNPQALAVLAEQISSINSNDALMAGAIAISMNGLDSVDSSAVDSQLQRYADTIRSRVRGKQPQALVAHLHELIFEEEDFCGNTDDYYNVNNNFLPTVLR